MNCKTAYNLFLANVRKVASAGNHSLSPSRILSQRLQACGVVRHPELVAGWAKRSLLRCNEPRLRAKRKNNNPFSDTTCVNIFSKNERGLTRDSHMEETILWLDSHKGYAAGLQETWKLGST